MLHATYRRGWRPPRPARFGQIFDLADYSAAAEERMRFQDRPALRTARSDDELLAERAVAERVRARERRQVLRSGLADASMADWERKVHERIRRTELKDELWHRRADADRKRATSPAALTAALYRQATWASRVLIGAVAVGMAWSGVNVQHNLVPGGDMADPLYWLSYGVEALVSVPLIIVMMVTATATRRGRTVARGRIALLEVCLLGTSLALNVAPHFAAAEWATAIEFGIAPVMVGVMLSLHGWVSRQYAMLIADHSDADETTSELLRRQETEVIAAVA